MTERARRVLPAAALLASFIAGCASDGYSGSSSVTVGTSFYYGHSWYDDPYYWYGPPGYVVVPPDRVDRPIDGPGGPGVAPPIANVPGAPGGPSVAPPIANAPGSGTRPTPTPQSSTRMPPSQPKVSSRPSSSRSSIPSRPRGGGGRRR